VTRLAGAFGRCAKGERSSTHRGRPSLARTSGAGTEETVQLPAADVQVKPAQGPCPAGVLHDPGRRSRAAVYVCHPIRTATTPGTVPAMVCAKGVMGRILAGDVDDSVAHLDSPVGVAEVAEDRGDVLSDQGVVTSQRPGPRRSG
jgi:hypothetical protein